MEVGFEQMSSADTDKLFAGSIPDLYDTHLVPLIFEPYAADLAARLALRPLGRVLEIAAGTGVATRAMDAALPETVSIVATDLNQPMLDHAAARGTARAVTWRQADAMQLPFAEGSFDAVVCQFGVMFFPVKGGAFAEVCRVLRPGGHFIFNVWDRIEENEFAHVVTTALATVFPDDPPLFLARTPHGYHDRDTIQRDLAAIAYCQGTPLRNEIEARDELRLAEATAFAAKAIADRFGGRSVDGKIQAHVVTIER
jgi:SAM-dependent methyltransferase